MGIETTAKRAANNTVSLLAEPRRASQGISRLLYFHAQRLDTTKIAGLLPSVSSSMPPTGPPSLTKLLEDIHPSTYHFHASGRTLCMSCQIWFNSFRGFHRHYQNSHSLVTASSNHTENDVSTFQTHSPPAREKNRHCLKCQLQFRNEVELQEHMASSVARHPHYCSACVTEFETFAALRSHYMHSIRCRPYISQSSSSQSSVPALSTLQDDQSQILPSEMAASMPSAPINMLGQSFAYRSNQGSDSPTCPICLSPLGDKTIFATFCGHLFCAPCILEHLEFGGECPKCRKSITAQMLIPVFF